jgi:hypothetical protein
MKMYDDIIVSFPPPTIKVTRQGFDGVVLINAVDFNPATDTRVDDVIQNANQWDLWNEKYGPTEQPRKPSCGEDFS